MTGWHNEEAVEEDGSLGGLLPMCLSLPQDLL